jgi:hypothetical protein
MKNWLYIPFLVLMAVTYTRLVDNYNSEDGFDLRRGPAFVQAQEVKTKETKTDENCENIATRFNPHLAKNCL